jgi:phage regulator Rha-like protein
MSGNIHDTIVRDIRREIDDLIEELRRIEISQESISEWTNTLQRKYKHLYRTSNTLFKFIVSNYGTPNFNEVFFNQTIDLMLNKIASIQNSQITQEDASTNVGTHLAHTFIPQLNQK